MAERIYNGMIPLLADMVAATVSGKGSSEKNSGRDLWEQSHMMKNFPVLQEKI